MTVPASFTVPAAFAASYSNYEAYPHNRIYEPLYADARLAFQKRFESDKSQLFQTEKEKSDIKVLDLSLDGQVLANKAIVSDDEVKAWIGDISKSTVNGLEGSVATHRDPSCRFIFLSAGSARNALKVTHRSTLRILSYHQVMPEYTDFISIFGSRERPQDHLFASFREETHLESPLKSLSMPDLGRSGRHFQLCYNLKATARKTGSAWITVQAAIHHQFDVEKGTTLWMITQGRLDLHDKIRNLSIPSENGQRRKPRTAIVAFRESLQIHLLNAHWAKDQWGPYVEVLTGRLNERTEAALRVSESSDLSEHTPETLRKLQLLEEQLNTADKVLSDNIQILTALGHYYHELTENPWFPLRDSCGPHLVTFVHEMGSVVKDMSQELARVRTLLQKTHNRKILIQQYVSIYQNEKTADLTINMREIALASHNEAVAVGIITIVTLVYLPATFVSTFFGTDVVKYQDTSSGTLSGLALQRWLEVTVPLTLLTLFIALGWFFKKYRDNQKQKGNQGTVPRYTVDPDSKARYSVSRAGTDLERQ